MGQPSAYLRRQTALVDVPTSADKAKKAPTGRKSPAKGRRQGKQKAQSTASRAGAKRRGTPAKGQKGVGADDQGDDDDDDEDDQQKAGPALDEPRRRKVDHLS